MARSGEGLNWWDLQPSLQRKLLEADPELAGHVEEHFGPDPRATKAQATDRVGRVARVSRKEPVDPEVQALLDETKLRLAQARLITEQAKGIEAQTRLQRARMKGHSDFHWPGYWTRALMWFVVVFVIIRVLA